MKSVAKKIVVASEMKRKLVARIATTLFRALSKETATFTRQIVTTQTEAFI